MEQSKFDELLILNVQQNEHLYDKRMPGYKDERRKENTWLSIAEVLNTDAETAKKRWENLRDRFVRTYRELSTVLPSGSGARTKTPSFMYYEEMKWLIPFLRKRKLTSSLGSPAVPHSPELSIEVGDGVYSVNEDGALVRLEETPGTSKTTEGARDSNEATQNVHEPRAKRPAIHDSINKAVTSLTTLMEARFAQPAASDGDMCFMRSVVEDMQLLSREKKVKFKRDVLDLLSKFINE